MTADAPEIDCGDFRPLFDGCSLAGWRAVPRVYGTRWPGGPTVLDRWRERGLALPVEPEEHAASWFVEDGAIVGEQATPGYGGYLVSEETFGDFELVLEARPDWPADTGVMVRRRRNDWEGFQITLDHRESGSIGGFFGNGLGAFSAAPFTLRSVRDADGRPIGIESDDVHTSSEPLAASAVERLRHAAGVEEFLSVWRWGEWNELRIRAVGALPLLTTWINGVKIAELDTATMQAPNYDPAAALALLGPRGHLALEVHDNDPVFGEARWGAGARCRWRALRIRNLDQP